MATELGKAYVQIIPSSKGIKDEMFKSMGGEGAGAGEQAGTSFAGGFKKAIVAAGIAAAAGKVIKTSFMQGAELQQTIGGVETLFKESSGKLQQYASQAYKTSGLSANEYMKNVTSFSASLLQSLGGDTSRAADVSNMAMTDMADNMNKMGTPLQSIQDAYQGFAKQNYTMLDNLKLGYGGTKTEMERLLSDAEKLTGKKYDINNLSDVYEAIHAIQGELGITGTTAKEAETTISGSFGMMKASWLDLMGQIAMGGNAASAIQNFVSSAITLLKNAIPMIVQIITTLPTAIAQVVAQLAPTLIPMLVEQIVAFANAIVTTLPIFLEAVLQIITGLTDGLIAAIPILLAALPQIIAGIVNFLTGAIPAIIQAGIKLFTALVKALPQIIQTIVSVLPQIIDSVISGLLSMLPLIIEAGVTLFIALVQALPEIIQIIVGVLPTIISSIINALSNNIPRIVDAGITLFIALVKAMPQIISAIVRAVPQIISSLVGAFSRGVGSMVSAGYNLLMGLARGIGQAVSGVVRAAANACKSVLNRVKSIFGIHSPSKVFEGYGVYLNEGLALGIKNSLKPVRNAMDKVKEETTEDIETEIAYRARVTSTELSYRVADNITTQSGPQVGDKLERILAILEDKLPELADKKLYLNTGALVGATAGAMDSELGNINILRNRGNI